MSRRKKITSNPVVRRLTGEAVSRRFVTKCAGCCATRVSCRVRNIFYVVTCGIRFESCRSNKLLLRKTVWLTRGCVSRLSGGSSGSLFFVLAEFVGAC